MPNVCPPGQTGQPKPGTIRVQNFLSGAIAEYLALRGMGWATSIAAGVAMMSFDTETLCIDGPPDLPNVDAARIGSWFNPFNPNGSSELRTDMYNLVAHFLWWDLCQCTGGTTPAAPSPVPQPNNYVTNPPALTPPLSLTSCANFGQVFENKTADGSGHVAWDTVGKPTVPPIAETLRITYNVQLQPGGGGLPVQLQFDLVNAAGTVLGTARATQTVAPTSTTDHAFIDVLVVPGTVTVNASSTSSSMANQSVQALINFDGYRCSGPGSTLEPCCPPDEEISRMLAQILLDLQQLLARGTGALGYTRGTTHSLLTGTASIPISGLAGMQAVVRSGVPTTPQLPGNPPYEWDLGWMSVMTADGMIDQKRLTRASQVWISQLFPLGTTFGYYLFPGISVDFTELQRA